MDANRQILFNHPLTAKASLRSFARINQFAHSTSVRSFVLCVLNQLAPSRIADGFSETVVSHHVLDGKIFKEDRAVAVHKFPAQFVSKVFSSIGNALVNVSNDLATFGSFVFGVSSLSASEFVFSTAKETRIVHSHTIRERGEGGETHINSNRQIMERQGSRFYFTSKAGIPIPHRIPLNIQGLDSAFDGAMLDDFQRANFGEKQTLVEKFKTCLRVGETIVSAIA